MSTTIAQKMQSNELPDQIKTDANETKTNNLIQSDIIENASNDTVAAYAKKADGDDTLGSPIKKTQSVSLYVGDIPKNLPNPEQLLYSIFCKVGILNSIRVCRDIGTHLSLGYAYVNYVNSKDAEKALALLNYKEIIPGHEMRIMWAVHDPTSCQNDNCTVFLRHIDPTMTNRQLFEIASKYGKVLSCKQAQNESGKKLGYGSVSYDTPEVAAEALDALNGYKHGEFVFSAVLFIDRDTRIKDDSTFTRLYCKNLHSNVTEEQLKEVFGKCGTVTDVFLGEHSKFLTKFAIVTMESNESARAAIQTLHESNELTEKDEKLYVVRLRPRLLTDMKNGAHNQGRNLYVKYLPFDITEDRMREIFEPFGKIESIHLMKDEAGVFRGFAFVCFETKEASLQAVAKLHRRFFIQNRPIYVQIAVTKERRTEFNSSRLQQIEQINAKQQKFMPNWPQFNDGGFINPYTNINRMPPFPGMPMGVQNRYNERTDFAQNFNSFNGFFGAAAASRTFRGNEAVAHNQMPFVAQQNNIRAAMAPRVGAVPAPQRVSHVIQNANQTNLMPNQMNRTNNQAMHDNFAAINNTNAQAATTSTEQTNASKPTASDGSKKPPVMNVQEISSRLTKMSENEKRYLLGDQLYNRISAIAPAQASKITGMLLELDTEEILFVLGNNQNLQKKIEEAIDVLGIKKM